MTVNIIATIGFNLLFFITLIQCQQQFQASLNGYTSNNFYTPSQPITSINQQQQSNLVDLNTNNNQFTNSAYNKYVNFMPLSQPLAINLQKPKIVYSQQQLGQLVQILSQAYKLDTGAPLTPIQIQKLTQDLSTIRQAGQSNLTPSDKQLLISVINYGPDATINRGAISDFIKDSITAISGWIAEFSKGFVSIFLGTFRQVICIFIGGCS